MRVRVSTFTCQIPLQLPSPAATKNSHGPGIWGSAQRLNGWDVDCVAWRGRFREQGFVEVVEVVGGWLSTYLAKWQGADGRKNVLDGRWIGCEVRAGTRKQKACKKGE
jgi:hypothetical protein